jgi:hypothetical protein
MIPWMTVNYVIHLTSWYWILIQFGLTNGDNFFLREVANVFTYRLDESNVSIAVQWFKWLVTGPSLRQPEFEPHTFPVDAVESKVALGYIFLPVPRFHMSVSFHQCSIFLFTSKASLNRRNGWNLAIFVQKQCSFGNRGMSQNKTTSTALF